MRTDYKITDDATIVRFDYRCKINGKYVVIEMQQKYKTDVNKRFYLSHCLGTALQLEDLEPKIITKLNGETYTEKNYGGLEPVITLIWMVDDTLNFTDDFIAFTTLPEAAKDFITDEILWNQPLNTILAERKKTLKILKNDSKDLDFFSKNRLIYAFQKNIIANKLLTKYFKWFDFAQKSRNFNNVKEDFSQYNNDDVMAEVIKRLKKDSLPQEEYKFISDIPLYEAYYQLEMEEITKKAEAKLKKIEVKAKKAEVKAEKAEVKAEKAEVKAEKAEQTLLKGIENLLKRGDTIESIAELLMRSVEDITALVAQIHSQKP